jgi:peptidoglycan/xylan/chitin deacetylase (PgdA/CDA1 family)
MIVHRNEPPERPTMTATDLIQHPFPWPEGKRTAACFSFDVDAESLLHLGFREDADNRVVTRSEMRYDAHVAVPRLLAIFRNHGIRQTFFVPGWCLEAYPEMVKAILDDGHEIAHHGYIHEMGNRLTPENERYWFERAVAAVERATGRKPAGFRAPSYGFSRHSLDLMFDHGMIYDASMMGHDVPYIIKHPRGEIVELPSQRALDDWTHFVLNRDFGWMMPLQTPEDGFAIYRAEFDAAWRHGGIWIAVWHPFVTARLSRAEAMEALIDHMKSKGGVWFAPLDEIARHAHKARADGRWQPFVDSMPYDAGGLPELAQRI